jgi:hypothetical protein
MSKNHLPNLEKDGTKNIKFSLKTVTEKTVVKANCRKRKKVLELVESAKRF